MIRLFRTLRGAQAAAGRRLPVVRLVSEPYEVWIVLPKGSTRIVAVNPETGGADGTTTWYELSTKGND